MIKKGFTLSESLIALVIIGVIAAMTVPLIFAPYQEQAIKSSLKKNYSVLKQALDKYQVENGERIRPDSIGSEEGKKLKNILINYLLVMYDCGYGYTDYKKACIPNNSQNSEESSKNYKTYNGKSYIDLTRFDDGQFVLNDGSLILFENAIKTSSRVYISVDVNGYSKKPNQLGKDLFMFQLMKDGELLPMGAKDTDYYSENDEYCSNISSNSMNGAGCTYKVLNN
ncbi:MAG: type II secretion system GspH family protein [Candidatus Gastranaerophilales bacterium]|nr:type II secretion system GspH family protein [Candidatus Gastranaerophilales bacterium]